jgi:hypothetical protein
VKDNGSFVFGKDMKKKAIKQVCLSLFCVSRGKKEAAQGE